MPGKTLNFKLASEQNLRSGKKPTIFELIAVEPN